jgi:hypothetical protein
MAQATVTARLYAEIAGTWTLLNDVQPWSANWGIPDNGPLDFVADVGEFKFRLDNSGGLYTPGGPSALSGFKKGVPVKAVFTFDGEDYVRFRGYIDEINISPSTKDKTAEVTCLDWMEYAVRHPMFDRGIIFSQSSDFVMDVVTAGVAIQPQQTEFEPGTFVFQSALDIRGTKTTAYTEYARIAFSDITHIYLKKDRTSGETLVLENDDKRHGWVTPAEFPIPSADSGLLLKEDGDQLLLETGDGLLLNEMAAVTMDGSVISDYDAPYGDNVVNRMTVRAHPRRLDASPQILFQLDEEFEISPRGAEDQNRNNYQLKGTYANPNGGEPVGGRDIITPVITTDYLMNSASDGSGVDISSSLYVFFESGTEGFTAWLANTNTTYPVGYVTKFNVRGTGIYEYNPIEFTEEQEQSISEHEAQSKVLDLRYRGGVWLGAPYVRSSVEEFGEARTRVKTISFCANKSNFLMTAFLNTDVGDLRYIEIDELGIAANHWIQGVSFEANNGLIWANWLVKEQPSLQGGFTDIAMDFTSANGDAVDYRRLPRVSASRVTERTFAAWINADLMDGVRSIIAPHADTGGVTMFLSDDGVGRLWFYSDRYPSPGTWRSNTTAITTGSWFHVVVCYNHSSATNDPIMYINGIPQTIIEDTAPSGTLNVELGTHVVIGNTKTVTIDYAEGFDGKIYDPRIYDRIITAAEAVTLYNAGTPDPSLVTDGLVFQPFAVRTDKITDFVNVALDDTYTLFENVYKSVGFVHGTPTARAAP